MKYVAAITLYNPSRAQIINCQKYKDSFDLVYIVDNSEEENKEIANAFDTTPFRYVKMNGNVGLPMAFNYVLDLAELYQYDFLCTLDQDSIYTNEQISNMKRFINQCQLNKIPGIDYSEVSIFAPIIDYNGSLLPINKYEKRNRVITSGSFLNLSIIQMLKLRYDNNYFIDKFEIDLCQQLILKKYIIVVNKASILIQCLGDGEKGTKSSHSVLRHYYLFRNRFYFNKKFFGFLKKNTLNILQTIRHCALIIAYEPEKLEKIKMLPIAYHDFKKNNMGKRI